MWAALFLYIVALYTLEDFAPSVASWVILAIAVIIILRRSVPGVTLRIASPLRFRAQTGRDLVPLPTRIVIVIVVVAASVGGYFRSNANLPAKLGAPDWMTHHSMAVTGVVLAIILTPLAGAVDAVGRASLARGRR